MLIIKSKISFLRNLRWDTPADGDLVFVGLDVKVEGGEGGRGGESCDSLGQEHVILGITTQALELRLFSQSPQNRWQLRKVLQTQTFKKSFNLCCTSCSSSSSDMKSSIHGVISKSYSVQAFRLDRVSLRDVVVSWKQDLLSGWLQ